VTSVVNGGAFTDLWMALLQVLCNVARNGGMVVFRRHSAMLLAVVIN
jgi:hypothetical protein